MEVVPTLELHHGSIDPPLDAQRRKGALKRFLLVDRDSIEGSSPSLSTYSLLSQGVELWVDPGARAPEDALDALVAGASKVLVDPLRMGGWEGVEELLSISEEGTVLLLLDLQAPPFLPPSKVAQRALEGGAELVVRSGEDPSWTSPFWPKGASVWWWGKTKPRSNPPPGVVGLLLPWKVVEADRG